MIKNDKSPFRFSKFIKSEKKLNEDELKEFNPFLINKLYYYSGREKQSNVLNYYWDIPKDLQYKLFVGLYKNVQHTRWIKSTKKK